MKVLVAEDDRMTREGLVELLLREGYMPIAATDGEQALQLYKRERPDFVCLDIMMPGLSGYEVCQRLRADDPLIPIIFISAKSEEVDRVVGLELGADDFIMKPFGVREVVARIRAVTRRTLGSRVNPNGDAPFRMGDLEVRPAELRARRGEAVYDLSLREICILRTLYRHRGKVVDRHTLCDNCWGHDYLPSSRSLDQQIAQLRKQIEIDPKSPQVIRTVHGSGYRFE